MNNAGQRRTKTAGESQFNQKAWGCLDLFRVLFHHRLLVEGLLLARRNLTIRGSLQSVTPFLANTFSEIRMKISFARGDPVRKGQLLLWTYLTC